MSRSGKYLIKVDSVTDVVRAWLFNFDKNDGRLKREHIDLLDAAIGPVIRDSGAISLLGLASTTGQAAYDKRLGEVRMQSVLNYLRANFGTAFFVFKEISFGKEMALAFKQAKLAGGTGDNVESELWRAVVINCWNRSLPPPPPVGVDVPFGNSSWAENVSKAIDVINIGLGILDLFATLFELGALAEVTGPAGLVAGMVQAIGELPLAWASADALADTNGQIQGGADAIQDMADQYSSDSLDRIDLSKWPSVNVPSVHVPDNPQPNVSQQAWRSGQMTGLLNAVQAVLDLEQQPKPFQLPDGQHIRVSGRLWLRAMSKAWGDNVGVQDVIIPANDKLKKRGRPPFPTH